MTDAFPVEGYLRTIVLERPAMLVGFRHMLTRPGFRHLDYTGIIDYVFYCISTEYSLIRIVADLVTEHYRQRKTFGSVDPDTERAYVQALTQLAESLYHDIHLRRLVDGSGRTILTYHSETTTSLTVVEYRPTLTL